MKIEFSSDGEMQITRKDGDKIGRINEAYFKTENDSEQAKITEKRRDWFMREFPEAANVIKVDDKIIGSTLVLPCTLRLMNLFISKNINEEQLFQELERTASYSNIETIYFCSAIIVPEFRRKGLATQAVEKSIKKMLSKTKNKVKTIFYWGYSNEGSALAGKIAKDLGLELKKR